MAVLPITLYGDKILRKKVNSVKEVDLKIIELIKNMFDTMRNAGGVGLAANQIGVNKSIFIVDISQNEGYEDYKPMVFINPRIIDKSEEKIVIEEGCLSIPDVRAPVIRPEKIQIAYQDTDLNEHVISAEKLFSRVIQHEYDHLQGILFIDKLTEEERKKLKKDLENIKKRRFEIEYPITEDVDYQLM